MKKNINKPTNKQKKCSLINITVLVVTNFIWR